jgi:hypothetical protein
VRNHLLIILSPGKFDPEVETASRNPSGIAGFRNYGFIAPGVFFCFSFNTNRDSDPGLDIVE